MPFGLTNAPATFQRLMQCVLAGILGELCFAYLHDIIVFSSTFKQHLSQLDAVLQHLQAANLKPKPAKCYFVQSKVQYLGHIISRDGIQVDLKKTAAISDFPVPTLSNYYQSSLKTMPVSLNPFISYFARMLEDMCVE